MPIFSAVKLSQETITDTRGVILRTKQREINWQSQNSCRTTSQ